MIEFKGISYRATAPKTAEILLYNDIGPSEYGLIDEKSFAETLSKVGDVSTINLRINSGGGGAFAGLAIYNMLKRHPATVMVDIDGIAASIASIIAMAGENIRMGEGAQMMIHDASTLQWGNARELTRAAALLDSMDADLAEIYARRTGRPTSEIRDMMHVETWFGASQAVLAKFADSLNDSEPVQVRLEPHIAARCKNPPKQLLAPREVIDMAKQRKQVSSLVARAAAYIPKEIN